MIVFTGSRGHHSIGSGSGGSQALVTTILAYGDSDEYFISNEYFYFDPNVFISAVYFYFN